MKQDKQKTKVLFLIERGFDFENKETFVENHVWAYFPNEKFDNMGVYKTCYAHVGQHSCCHPDYAKECDKATPEQYKDLKQELESIGYNLEILN